MKVNLINQAGKLLAVALLASLLVGCSGAAATLAATQPPTAAAIPTQPAAPTSLPAQPATATPIPTAAPTQVPPTLAPTATLIPTVTLEPTATETASPMPTGTTPSLSAQALKIWSYANKTVYVANEGFLLGIYLKNSGSQTWTPGYQLRFTGQTNGGDITVQPVANLTVEVKPGGKVEFDLWAFGSEKLGDHTWQFQLFTDTDKIVPGSQCSITITSIHN